MKLRNKKTGELGFVYTGMNGEVKVCSLHSDIHECLGEYKCLDKLNDEWEDYEEPKDHWHIGCEGDIFVDITEKSFQNYLLIGNDFETKEEAEKAVEKLKAWKRLKDKGFKPAVRKQDQYLYLEACWGDDYDGKMKDLDLLFGGEE